MLAMDIDIGQSAHDMTDPRTVDNMMEAVDTQDITYVHLAIPCNTFSIARWPTLRTRQFPMGVHGLPERETLVVLKSNACVHNSFDAIEN